MLRESSSVSPETGHRRDELGERAARRRHDGLAATPRHDQPKGSSHEIGKRNARARLMSREDLGVRQRREVPDPTVDVWRMRCSRDGCPMGTA
jgi:hypothetical protein